MAQPTNSTDHSSAAAAVDAPLRRGSRGLRTSIRYVDCPDMAETFVDSIAGLVFDGQTLRIEFGVTRFGEMRPNSQVTCRRYPACRLVLSPAAAVIGSPACITRRRQSHKPVQQGDLRAQQGSPKAQRPETRKQGRCYVDRRHFAPRA